MFSGYRDRRRSTNERAACLPAFDVIARSGDAVTRLGRGARDSPTRAAIRAFDSSRQASAAAPDLQPQCMALRAPRGRNVGGGAWLRDRAGRSGRARYAMAVEAIHQPREAVRVDRPTRYRHAIPRDCLRERVGAFVQGRCYDLPWLESRSIVMSVRSRTVTVCRASSFFRVCRQGSNGGRQ